MVTRGRLFGRRMLGRGGCDRFLNFDFGFAIGEGEGRREREC